MTYLILVSIFTCCKWVLYYYYLIKPILFFSWLSCQTEHFLLMCDGFVWNIS